MFRAILLSCLFAALQAAFSPLAAQQRASARPGPERYLEEGFSYNNGNLRDVSNRAWGKREGDPAIAVVNREAVLGPYRPDAGGYVVRRFTRPASSPVVELMAAIRVDVAEPGAALVATGETFLQMAGNEGKSRRGRVALKAGEEGQTFRLGAASKTTGRVRWAPGEFALGQVHLVRLVYDTASGRTWLWVNPTTADQPPLVEAVEDGAMPVDRLSLQVGDGMGNARIRVSRVVVQRGEIPAVVETARAGGPQPEITPTIVAPTDVAARAAVVPPAREKLWIFLLAGQSNMAGRGAVEAEDRTPNPRILTWQRNGTWATAIEPLHDDKPAVAGVGPGLAFARALLETVPEDVTIGLVPAAFGGTRISWWSRDYVGSQRWEHGLTFYQNLITAARQAGQTGVIKGILWNQGESDARSAEEDDGASYRQRLSTLIANIREDLNAPDLPFVAATLGPWRAETSGAINRVFLALPQSVQRTAVVDTTTRGSELRNKVGDPPHYDSASARLLGRLYAEALRPLLD